MMAPISVLAPFAGWAAPLAEVSDAVFAEGLMGPGLALDPLEGVVRAPCAGVVANLAGTGHSVTLRLANGADLLIHVGVDTVALKGAGFRADVAVGQPVEAGQVLIAFDLDAVALGARSLITPILVANEGFRVVDLAQGALAAGAPLFAVAPVEGAGAQADVAAEGPGVERRLTVMLEHGVHARPAARIASAARGFAADVALLAPARGGAGSPRQASARSPVALMALDLRLGDEVTLRATGVEGEAAIAALAAILGAGDPDAGEAGPAAATPAQGPVCASPGLALGPLAWLHVAAPEVPRDAADPAEEHRRLAEARQKAAAHLGAGSIAEAHRALLDDPELLAAAQIAMAQGRSAGWAWQQASAAQAEALRATGNPRLIERIADLEDVAGQVLAGLGHGGDIGLADVPQGAILVAQDLLPTQFMALAGRLAGICLAAGGPTSHVAILAHAAGVPMLVAAGAPMLEAARAAGEGVPVLLDVGAGRLDLAPTPEALAAARRRLAASATLRAAQQAAAAAPCHTADGTRIEVFANLASLDEARSALAAGAEGCGLLRSEFLFMDRATPPAFAEQLDTYQGIATALDGRPLIIRTLDVGADKPLAYLPMPPEENPALGQRGLRLGLARPALLAEQLAAILAVRPLGQCRIMAPMVVDAGELRALRALLDDTARAAGIAEHIELGVMIETPAAALLADQLAAEADFLSIGTNDLTQYTLAADRGNPATAAMIDALHPSVLRLVAQACTGAAARDCPVGVCGSAAGDPLAAPLLIGLGVRELSVAPARIAAIKALLGTIDMEEARALAAQALACDAPAAVRALVRQRLGTRLGEA